MYNMSFLSLIFFSILLSSCSDGDTRHQYTGILEGTSVNVPALTGGQLLQVYFMEGDFVRKGQKLAVIDSSELHYQRQQLHATLEEVVIQAEMAQSNIRAALADKKYIQQKHDRIASLVESKSAPQQNLDDIANQLQKIKTVVETANQNLSGLAARQKQLQAQLNLIKKKLGDCVVVTPAEGIITSKFYENGEAVFAMSPLAEIIDIRHLESKIYISESMLPNIKHGQEVLIRVDGSESSFSGKVSWISPQAEFTPKTILTPETRTSLVYAVVITLKNKEGTLKDGMPVVIELDL